MTTRIYDFKDRQAETDFRGRVTEALEQGIREHGQVRLMFRADDIGVPGARFARMTEVFIQHRIPLGLAVVPAWLTRKRWESLGDLARRGEGVLSWHQHGWRHVNHEPEGKKWEFGPARSREGVRHDISKGCVRLEALLGDRFARQFTPPWNRCTPETLAVLVELGFTHVSGSKGSFSSLPAALAEYPMHVDLHTRKDICPESGREAFFRELLRGMASGVCGIMLHHNRMSPPAFIFLEFLLEQIVRYPEISCLNWIP